MKPGVGPEAGVPLIISLMVKRVYSSSTAPKTGDTGRVASGVPVVEEARRGGKMSFRNQNFLVRTASRAWAVRMFSSTYNFPGVVYFITSVLKDKKL